MNNNLLHKNIFNRSLKNKDYSFYTIAFQRRYYGARYQDPKTSRWLSTDPALSSYLPTAGGDNSQLPGMGGIYNTINMHLYHYAGNNPVKYTDPNGREVDDQTLANAEAAIQNTATQVTSLKDLVNTGRLADLIVSNSSNLDSDTANFVNGLGDTDYQRADALESMLNDVTVYAGVDAELADATVKGLSGGNQEFLDGLSVGSNIYMRDEITSVDASTANLLGHEAIHSIQATAVGKSDFLNYSANMPYTDANKFEAAAYKFGGGIPLRGFDSISSFRGNQILRKAGNW